MGQTTEDALPFPIKYMVAPMVGQSDISFRILCRRHGAHVAYTEMLYSERFVSDSVYRKDSLQTCPEDHPLVVQLCGNNADIMSQAARLAEGSCEAVDINLGCPQQRAQDGHYGSYLLDRKDWGTVFEMVGCLKNDLSIPVFCKIRLLPRLDETLEFCRGLQQAGCSLLAVHGRQRGSPRARRCGPADLAAIKAIKEAVSMPVIANGNVRSAADVAKNLEMTGADGIMSAEGILADPKLYEGGASGRSDRLSTAMEYIQLCREWATPLDTARQHINHILGKHGQGAMVSFDYYGSFRRNIDLKRALDNVKCLDDFQAVLDKSLGVLNCGGTSPLLASTVVEYH